MKKCLFIGMVFALIGCEKQLPFDNLDFVPKLVLNGFLSSDSTMNMSMSKSSSTLTDPMLNLLRGKVKVLVLKDGLLLMSDSVALQSGRLLLPYKPIGGSTYEVQVGYNGLPPIRAKDAVPNTKPDFSLDTITDEDENYRVFIQLKDVLDTSKYALSINVVGKEKVGQDSIAKRYPIAFTSTDKLFLSNIRTVSTGRRLAIFSDETWNGNERNTELVFKKGLIKHPNFEPSEIEVVLKIISETMYNYYIDVNNNTHVYGGPLASVSRVSGNVEQGLGAFCFYTEAVRQRKIP